MIAPVERELVQETEGAHGVCKGDVLMWNEFVRSWSSMLFVIGGEIQFGLKLNRKSSPLRISTVWEFGECVQSASLLTSSGDLEMFQTRVVAHIQSASWRTKRNKHGFYESACHICFREIAMCGTPDTCVGIGRTFAITHEKFVMEPSQNTGGWRPLT